MPDGHNKQILKFDRTSGAAINIDTLHAHIHRGRAFTCSASITIGNNATHDAIIWVPNSLEPHLRIYRLDVDAAPFDITLYEGPFTIVNSGVQCVPRNLNRKSGNVSSMGIAVTAVASLVPGSFTQLEYHRITGAKQTGGSEENAVTEWDLKPDTEYLIRMTNIAAGAAPGGLFIYHYE